MDIKKTIAIQQPEHAPWLGFFHKMSKVDEYVFLDNAQFKKRYFENRNKIKTIKGWQWITVPVISKGRYRQKINEVIIDNGLPWRRKYLNALRHAYAKSPYFDAYNERIDKIINSKWGKLIEFNIELIAFFRSVFNLNNIPTLIASALVGDKDLTGSDLILEICKSLKATTYLSGPDGANYLKADDFASSGIEIQFHTYEHPVYSQLHGSFISNMSSFDFLFNSDSAGFNLS